jgi:hypothetical protein
MSAACKAKCIDVCPSELECDACASVDAAAIPGIEHLRAACAVLRHRSEIGDVTFVGQVPRVHEDRDAVAERHANLHAQQRSRFS